MIELRDFRPGDELAFRRLNEQWIRRYFVLENKDADSLRDPQTTILDRGGRIIVAEQDGVAVGCCALVAVSAGELEVAKMAVDESARGLGIGRRILAHVVEVARGAGTRRLYLETNSTLAPALALYAKAGFIPVPTARIVPSPYARVDVYLELFL